MIRLIVGLLLSTMIAYIAFRKKLLSFDGLIGSITLGTLLYFWGGIYLSAIMVAFFVSASLLTKFKNEDKKFLKDINEKSGGRDYGQVFANGGLALVYGLLYYITKNNAFLIGYATVFSSANSDTWSSEIGVLSKKPPLSIVTLDKMEAGMSGGISLLGLTAGFIGSFFIAVIFFIGYLLAYGWTPKLPYYFILIGFSGLLGSIIDSYLGALIQTKYKCTICGKITEKKLHHEKRTIHIRGFDIINNDVVNFLSCLSSSFIAVLLSTLL